MPLSPSPRVLALLVGDVKNDPSARTKYGALFAALGRRLPLVGVYDATLRGLDRALNALQVWHPRPAVWRERFYKNVPAFQRRSERAAQWLAAQRAQADVILQVGVLFDARWQPVLPSVIYTDYTATLSAQRVEAGRSPFTPTQRAAWIAHEKQAFERAAHIAARAQFVRDSVVNDYGLAPDKVSVIGGGVNFDPLPAVPARLLDAPPTVLFIGKDFYRKGGDVLLAAFARARAEFPAARLLLVTNGPLPTGADLTNVEVIAPTWERAVIATLFARADSCVLPSRLETWGDVLLEAMAYGLPCLGVTGQAMEDIIVPEQTGLLVPPADPEALAAALLRLWRNRPASAAWGQAGRARVAAQFTWDNVAERLEERLREAGNAGTIGNPSRPSAP